MYTVYKYRIIVKYCSVDIYIEIYVQLLIQVLKSFLYSFLRKRFISVVCARRQIMIFEDERIYTTEMCHADAQYIYCDIKCS